MTKNERLGSAELPIVNVMQRVLAWAGIRKSADEVPVETVDKPTDIGARLADAGVTPSQFGALMDARYSRPDVAPPIVETDPTKSLRHYIGDYRSFRYGSKRVTIFLEEGRTLVEPPSDDRDLKTFDGVVDGLTYVTPVDIVLKQGRDQAFAISNLVREESTAEMFHPESAESYQILFRRGLDEPDLELVHVVTGIEAGGNSITFFGIRVPEQMQA